MSSKHHSLYLCIDFPTKVGDDIFDGYIFDVHQINHEYVTLLNAVKKVGMSHKRSYLVKNDTFSSRKVEY